VAEAYMKYGLLEGLIQLMQNKVMYAQYIISIDRQLIGEEDTLLWLSRGEQKVE
jgi:hypothetical protein